MQKIVFTPRQCQEDRRITLRHVRQRRKDRIKVILAGEELGY